MIQVLLGSAGQAAVVGARSGAGPAVGRYLGDLSADSGRYLGEGLKLAVKTPTERYIM